MNFVVRIRIYLLAGRNLLWDILRLPSSRRAALGLYVILTLWRTRGANQPPYASLHRSSLCYALRHGRRRRDTDVSVMSSWGMTEGDLGQAPQADTAVDEEREREVGLLAQNNILSNNNYSIYFRTTWDRCMGCIIRNCQFHSSSNNT